MHYLNICSEGFLYSYIGFILIYFSTINNPIFITDLSVDDRCLSVLLNQPLIYSFPL